MLSWAKKRGLKGRTIFLSEEDDKKLKILASEDSRKPSNYIRHWLSAHIANAWEARFGKIRPKT